MAVTQSKRTRIRRAGVAAITAGVILAATGISMSPASAGEKTTICHATSSVTNPYREISVDLSATHGPDHTTHTGEVFDPAVNTTNKPAWGDIIPNGLNWTEAGIAIWEGVEGLKCQMPGEPPDSPPCEFDDTIGADDPLCVAPTTTTTPTTTPTTVAASVTTALVAGVQIVATPAAPAPAAAAAALPRTGTTTLPLAEVGFGLLLLGVGALISSREQAFTV